MFGQFLGGSGAGPSSPLVRGPFASSKHLGGAKALGGCRSLGCRGYLRALLDARISLGTTTRLHTHLPQAHLLAMSLNFVNSSDSSSVISKTPNIRQTYLSQRIPKVFCLGISKCIFPQIILSRLSKEDRVQS